MNDKIETIALNDDALDVVNGGGLKGIAGGAVVGACIGGLVGGIIGGVVGHFAEEPSSVNPFN